MPEKSKEEFDWIQLKNEINSPIDIRTEGIKDKFIRRFGENPFVPIGALLTACCLAMGLNSFRKGNQKQSQMMMRARVVAQGFTICALIGGLFLSASKVVKKEK